MISARARAAAAAAVLCAGCTPAQVQWWASASEEDRAPVTVHIIESAAAEFGVDAEVMLRVARCESGLRTEAVNRTSGAAGLFQHLPQFWPPRAAAVGDPDATPANPVTNARAAAWMMSTQGLSPWASSRSCWQ